MDPSPSRDRRLLVAGILCLLATPVSLLLAAVAGVGGVGSLILGWASIATAAAALVLGLITRGRRATLLLVVPSFVYLAIVLDPF